jgi:hypothetical protein
MGWPPASIEHTDRMLIYGPSKPSSLSSIKTWLTPTASLAVRGEKLGGDLQIGSRCARDVVGNPYFSGAVGSVQICRWLMNDCYMWTTWDTYDRGSYADRVWKACYVLIGFSPTRCTSIWITVTLANPIMILVRINHHCLRVECHSWYQSTTGIIHHVWSYFWKLRWGYT